MKRAEILEAARVCVCGERERDYASPEAFLTNWSPLEATVTVKRRF